MIKLIEMKCQLCSKNLPEPKIEESHNVPCYLFKGESRKERKNQADKFDRHLLCEQCHEEYEEMLRKYLISCAVNFGDCFFNIKKEEQQ